MELFLLTRIKVFLISFFERASILRENLSASRGREPLTFDGISTGLWGSFKPGFRLDADGGVSGDEEQLLDSPSERFESRSFDGFCGLRLGPKLPS